MKQPTESSLRLTDEEKRILLSLAREAIECAVQGRKLRPVDIRTLPETLRNQGACFVTLNKHGALRGCIGTLEARSPIFRDVRKRAVDAATRDYRFPPVGPEELEEIEIEISILSQPKPLEYANPAQIPQLLRPGIDGVILISGLHRATFLPQVWEKVSDPYLFLEMLCRKAILPGDAWRSGEVQVLTYQVESFQESDFSEQSSTQ